MEVPVEWLEMRDNGSAVVKIKQKKGGNMPITVTVEDIHKQYPRMKNINNLETLVGMLKKKGGKFNLEKFKTLDKRTRRLELRAEEERWSA